jgi:hypothetical protein
VVSGPSEFCQGPEIRIEYLTYLLDPLAIVRETLHGRLPDVRLALT